MFISNTTNLRPSHQISRELKESTKFKVKANRSGNREQDLSD